MKPIYEQEYCNVICGRVHVSRFRWTKCSAMPRSCARRLRERASLRWNTVATVPRCRKPRNSWCSDGRNSRTNLYRTARSKVDIKHHDSDKSNVTATTKVSQLVMPLIVHCRIISKLDSAVQKWLLIVSQEHFVNCNVQYVWLIMSTSTWWPGPPGITVLKVKHSCLLKIFSKLPISTILSYHT